MPGARKGTGRDGNMSSAASSERILQASALEHVHPYAQRRTGTLPASIQESMEDLNTLMNYPDAPRMIMVYGDDGVGKTFMLEQFACNATRLPHPRNRRRMVMSMKPVPEDDSTPILDTCKAINCLDDDIHMIVLCGKDIEEARMMALECPRASFIVEEKSSFIGQFNDFDDFNSTILEGFRPVLVPSAITCGEILAEARHISAHAAKSLGVKPMTAKALREFLISLLKTAYPSRRSDPEPDELIDDVTIGYIADRISYAYARSLEPPCEKTIGVKTARGLAYDAFNDLPSCDDGFEQPSRPAAEPASGQLAWASAKPGTASARKQSTRIMEYRDPLRLPDRLMAKVISQDDAVKSLSSKILLDAAKLKRPDKPVGSFLFVGPSGVGKTQLAKALSEELLDGPMNFIRIDCSEFAERHTESRLFGSPPGYVGYEEGGELTGKVRDHPQSVILLDEAEKASPHIWDVFLQVFDAARLTDGAGITTDFSHCVIIMTSNLGSDARNSAGFGASDDGHAYMDAVRRYFRPEFINRLDAVCVFRKLDMPSYRRIIDMKIDDAEERIRREYEADVTISMDDSVISWILDRNGGFDHGARGIDDVIGNGILLPIARDILSKDIDIRHAGVISISMDGGRPAITSMKASS